MTDATLRPGLFDADAWSWWEARRLRYNLVLAATGVIAYAAAVAIYAAFGFPVWRNWLGNLGLTLLLGLGFLVLMGCANVCYLAGALMESLARPADRDAFRRRAFAMGLWGSAALPFFFPLGNLALLMMTAA